MLTKTNPYQKKLTSQEKRTIQARVKDWAKQEQRRKKLNIQEKQKSPTIDLTESLEYQERKHTYTQEKSSACISTNETKQPYIVAGVALPHTCERCEIYETHLKLIQIQFEVLKREIHRLNKYELDQHES